MDFFHLSKLFWLLAMPGNLAVLVLAVALVLSWTRWRRLARILVAIDTVTLIAVMLLPVDQWLTRPLEDRFPRPTLPPCVDGILLLGGGELPRISETRGDPAVGVAGRYAATAVLMRRYPDAKIVFSGGSSAVFVPESAKLAPEAATAVALFREWGVDPARLTLETSSRNTWENLVFSRRLVQPKPGETWLLVTDALHMPRSIGIARQVGWPMLPWPTDYQTPGDGAPPVLHWDLGENIGLLDLATKEWIGLVAYRLTGKSSALFPSPEPAAGAACPAGQALP